MARGDSKSPQNDLPGDGGIREEEVTQATEALEAMAEAIDLGEDRGAIVARATAFLVELFKARPKPWGQMSQAEQRDVVAALETNAKELVRRIAETVAKNGAEPVRCLLEGYTEKDGIKATLKVKPMDEDEEEAAVLALHRARGKFVLLTVASADDYHSTPARDESQPDQPALGFEAGTDEIDLEASDLAEEEETAV